MALFIPYNFDDARGRFLNWDSTQDQQGNKAYLTTQDHVDLRVMLGSDLVEPRPLNDLELVALEFLESNTDYSPQVKMEQRVLVKGDNWQRTGTGFSAMAVGPNATKNNWRLMELTTDAAAISTDLVSSIPHDTTVPPSAPVDLSTQDFLSIVIAGDIDRSGFTQATSNVTLTSRTDADFAQATGRSLVVPFTANSGGGATELRIPISDFNTTDFSLANVTGIRIHLERAAPAAGLKVYIGGVRGIDSAWVTRRLDQNTRLKTYEYPVTLDLNAATAAVPLIRGNRNIEDPQPADGVLNATFITGGSTGSNFQATGADYNEVHLYFREIYDAAEDEGSWIRASLRWKDTGAEIVVTRQNWDGVTVSDVGSTTQALPATLERRGADLNSGRYMFYVQFIGNKITATVYKLDAADVVTSTVFQTVFEDTDYTFRQGRAGLHANFIDRDAYLDDFSAAAVGFATAVSRVFNSLTPVDGAQLQAVFSEDVNLWTSFHATDLFLDLSKTTTGRGGYSSTLQLMTNQFLLEDWLNTYIEFDIWVPITVTPENQPELTLLGAGVTLRPPIPDLQGGQWNRISVNLEEFAANLTGIPYVAVIEPRQRDLQLGKFWVDDMRIMRRLISWQVRARSDASFREFRSMVNREDGAVHLPLAERGTELQLQAVALREDAWIASFHLFPHYAELGLPVYDLGYETH